ncbi:MAG: carbohydrate ABC transporter substrate-binding protein, partial [Oscillospiraceae bacterium]|nr:carbohydrate ABC transporter substrate-binding protein [Oscillospiraceae bacterium]
MRKRVGALCITAAILFSLTGCGKPADGQQEIRFSWWGGDSRHQATITATELFMTAHPDITVRTEYGAWSGWEDAASAALYAGTEADVMQVNRNWLTDYSSETSGFLDLRQFSNIIDLTQYDPDVLDMCTAEGKLLAVPVSRTGRVFLWNETTYEQAGLPIPDSYSALCTAGSVFREKLGDDYYPLALGWYDRMLFLVYMLQCQYGREWVADGALQYSQAEIEAGLCRIAEMEQNHVIPPLKQITGGGADSFDKDESFITGRYAGIFEWDSSAGKFVSALSDGQTLTVGDYFTDLGDFHGGFSKISLGFAISRHTKHPEACAQLIAALVSDPETVRTLGTERGIPLNKKGYEICSDAGLLGDISAEA